jgi:hypothetical protein
MHQKLPPYQEQTSEQTLADGTFLLYSNAHPNVAHRVHDQLYTK